MQSYAKKKYAKYKKLRMELPALCLRADRVVRGVGCDDAMEAASMLKAGIRPTCCNKVLRLHIPYVHNMSGFGDVRAQQGTASPPGQAWGPFPDGTEGGLMPATHVSET